MIGNVMNYSKIVKLFEERKKKREKERERILKKIKSKEGYRILHNYPEIKRVYLLGSILREGLFSSLSDIDIAVEGIDSKNFLALFGDLEKLTGRPLDIITLEKTKGSLRKFILEKGVLIYERRATRT